MARLAEGNRGAGAIDRNLKDRRGAAIHAVQSRLAKAEVAAKIRDVVVDRATAGDDPETVAAKVVNENLNRIVWLANRNQSRLPTPCRRAKNHFAHSVT